VAVLTGPARSEAAPPSPDHGERDLAGLTPATLLAPGETEIALFQDVYAQTRFFDAQRRRRDAGGRATYSTTSLSLRRGASPRLTFGLGATLRSVRDEAAVRRDPPAETDRRTALAWIAPRLETAPWRAHPTWTLEASLRIPTASGLEGADDADPDERPEAPFLDTGDPTLVVRLRNDRGAGRRAYLYTEIGAELRADGNGANGASTPAQLIAHLLPSDAWTFFVPLGLTPYWGGAANGDWSSRVGLGAKFRPRSGWEVESLVTIFPAGRNQGAGTAFGLGARRVR
jgi:hypothetical protein